MIGFVLSTMLAATPAAAAGPLAPAMAGQVQCYVPDVRRKTCRSLGAYARGVDGEIQNTAVVMVSEAPLATMETTAPVSVKDGAVCATVTERDIETARFRVEGAPAEAERAEGLRAAMGEAMRPLIGHEVCTTYVAGEAGALTARASLDGKPAPTLDQPMIWVSPQDGYRIGP